MSCGQRRVSIGVETPWHDMSSKGKHLIEVAHWQFRGSVHYHYGEEHGSEKADMVLEKEVRVLQLSGQNVNWDTGGYPKHRKPQILPPEWDTSSNKAMPTPTKPHLPIFLN